MRSGVLCSARPGALNRLRVARKPTTSSPRFLPAYRGPVLRKQISRPVSCSNGTTPEPTTNGATNVELFVSSGDDLVVDERVSPLWVALEKAKAKMSESTSVREALEAEAQEVAQLAVEATEAKELAKGRVFNAVAEIEAATLQQKEATDQLSALQAKLEAARAAAAAAAAAAADAAAAAAAKAAAEAGIELEAVKEEEEGRQPVVVGSEVERAEFAAIEKQVEEAERGVEELSSTLDNLRDKVKSLFEKAVAAEAAALRAEEVAAAAMKAAEGAVKDEVEASAVVRETQAALEKTMGELQALDAQRKAAEAEEAEPEKVESSIGRSEQQASSTTSSTTTAETSKEDAQVTVDTESKSSTASSSSRSAPAPASTASRNLLVGLAVIAAAAGLYFFSLSTYGQAALATLGNLTQQLGGQFELSHTEGGLVETIWLLLTSIICVPAVCKIVPGGNPVLGYLVGGALVGPYALGIIHDVNHVRHLAELGVVFLLFNIGLELSLERLQSMAKFVFGLGSLQVVLTLLGVAGTAMAVTTLSGPSAIILGGALAMSTTAVAIQVLEDRGEMGSRHGRTTFSVLLFQDLAVVVLLMLIPLLAPSDTGATGGFGTIAKALGAAAVKATLCIIGIIAGGRAIVRPLYKKIANFANKEIFAATGLLMVLGTSVLTQVAGLSLALGAFLAGLLLAETEYALQVESDIAPYKGLLMGLFFMTVGMEISAQLFIAKWRSILAALTVLIVGKVAVMAAVGPMFGLSRVTAVRAGLLLAPGGEFAFVAFGEAVSRGVLPAGMSNELYLMVALSMALTPYLAALGSKLGKMYEKKDMQALQPSEGETGEMKDHIIIAGYGRVGQIIGQLLSEELIPFVALDVNSNRVQQGRNLDLPVYFGDAGSPAVLHSVGAERAAAAVITLDTPGANYRSVWALHKHFPNLKIYVRAHDINHGINLEKAGATAVVPETLEPSLQLAAAVLRKKDYPQDEVSSIVDQFRRKHLAELQEISVQSGSTLGYGFAKPPESSADKGLADSIPSVSVAASPA